MIPVLALCRRNGGSLYPVLIVVGLLFLISTMLPQVLVQASGAIRADHTRDHVIQTLDSAIAFAEARLKLQLSTFVETGQAARGGGAPAGGWSIHPGLDNPDFGRNKPCDYEVTCKKISLFTKENSELQENYRFAYILDVGVWDADRRMSKHEEVTGLITISALATRTGLRSIQNIKIEAINREKTEPYAMAGPVPR